MNKKDLEQKKAQLVEMRDVLASYFEKEDMEVGMVMSVLLTMLVEIMMQHLKMPPHTAMLLMNKAVAHAYDELNDEEEEDDDNEGVSQWLN
jgi:Na+/citrate or Na+/malate symporter